MVAARRRDPSVPIVAMRAVWRGGLRVEDAAHAGASTLLARMITRGCGTLDAAELADESIASVARSVASPAATASASRPSGSRSRGTPGSSSSPTACSHPSLRRRRAARENRALLADQVAQGDNPTPGRVPPVQRGALRHASVRARRARHAESIGDLSRGARAVLSRALSDLGADAGDGRRCRGRRGRSRGDARFGAAKARKVIAPKIAAPSFDSAHEVYRFLERAQAHLVVGFPGATIDAKDRFALEVLVAVLGGQSGRLFGELRDRQGLVYRVSAHSVEGVDPGFVAIYLSCAPEKLEAAVAAVRGELKRVRDDGITAESSSARRLPDRQPPDRDAAAVAVANAIAYYEAYGLGWKSWAGYDDAIRAVRSTRSRWRRRRTSAKTARSPRPYGRRSDARGGEEEQAAAGGVSPDVATGSSEGEAADVMTVADADR